MKPQKRNEQKEQSANSKDWMETKVQLREVATDYASGGKKPAKRNFPKEK